VALRILHLNDSANALIYHILTCRLCDGKVL
jgi:hypothetical protein